MNVNFHTPDRAFTAVSAAKIPYVDADPEAFAAAARRLLTGPIFRLNEEDAAASVENMLPCLSAIAKHARGDAEISPVAGAGWRVWQRSGFTWSGKGPTRGDLDTIGMHSPGRGRGPHFVSGL